LTYKLNLDTVKQNHHAKIYRFKCLRSTVMREHTDTHSRPIAVPGPQKSMSGWKMYAGHVACCHLVSHVEYTTRSIKVKKDGTDRQTDGRMPDARHGHAA